MTLTWAGALWWLWAPLRFVLAPWLRLGLFVVQAAMFLVASGLLFGLALWGSTAPLTDTALLVLCGAIGVLAREARWRV
jgi:hypothetical protein